MRTTGSRSANATSLESLYADLKNFIKENKNLSRVDSLHICKNCECNLVCIIPPGCREISRLRVAENDTRYENISKSEATISHTANFDARKLIGKRTSKSKKMTIGGPVAVNFFQSVGASAEIAKFELGQTTEYVDHDDKGESHSYSVGVKVPAQEIIIVKEVIYEIEKEAECQLDLTFPKNNKMSYAGWKRGVGEVHKNTGQQTGMFIPENPKWPVRKEASSGAIICTVTATCQFTTFEHSVQVIGTGNPDMKRFQDIINLYNTSIEDPRTPNDATPSACALPTPSLHDSDTRTVKSSPIRTGPRKKRNPLEATNNVTSAGSGMNTDESKLASYTSSSNDGDILSLDWITKIMYVDT